MAGISREFAISRRARTPHSVGRDIATAIYTEELFSTGHDAANRAAVAGVPAEELNLVGVALRGAKNGVDRVVKGARMRA